MLKSTLTQSWLRILQTIFFTSAILYFGRDLLVPVLYGLFIAIVLYPVCKRLERRRWPKSLAIAAGMLIVISGFLVIGYLFFYQLSLLRNDIPAIAQKVKPGIAQLQQWASDNAGLSMKFQEIWLQKIRESINGNIGHMAQVTLATVANGIVTLFLVPVYAVLFLYERNSFIYFLNKIAGGNFKNNLHNVLQDVIHTYSSFVSGMVIVYFIVGCLNTVGLLALGIPHALLFGMLTAVMTIIPYIGIFISALIPITIAWLTKDSIWYPLGVIAVFAFVQYLEANVIFPRVVGTKLKITTWAMLVGIISGGLLWGVSGMILFIPLLGIFKILLDYIPEWKPAKLLLQREERVTIQTH
jgi:predicted PurR-regulated permease PerM